VLKQADDSLERERNPTQESIDDRLRKRKRRAITVRAADVGKEAQDMRIPNGENYKTKKVRRVRDTRLMSSSGQSMQMAISFDLLLSAQLTHFLVPTS